MELFVTAASFRPTLTNKNISMVAKNTSSVLMENGAFPSKDEGYQYV